MNKRTALLLIALVIAFGLGMVYNRVAKNSYELAQDNESTSEFMDEYLESYSEMIKSGNEENMLVVISDQLPHSVDAMSVVEGPNHTYFLMYDSSESRDTAYQKFSVDDSVTVERNELLQISEQDYNSWGISAMGLDYALEQTEYGNNPVDVAIVDTGIDVELFQEYYPDTGIYTYDLETDSTAEADMYDTVGHGTHIAGTIAEGTPANVAIYAIKASRGDSEQFYSSDITTAIYKAVNDGAEVINMSFGSYSSIFSHQLAIEYARERNVITVAAAGNDGSSEPQYPAGYYNALSVSAVNPDLSIAKYSNYGSTIDFAAPGTYILSINGIKSGTSMATPHVSAAVAMLKSYNNDLSFNDVKNLLKQYSQDLGEPDWDEEFGYGLIDFRGADFCSDSEKCDEFGVFVVDNNLPEVTIIDKTSGIAEIELFADSVRVIAERACTVIVTNDKGENYYRVLALPDDDAYRFQYELNDGMEVTVALKGDANLDGEITSSDLNLLTRSLVGAHLSAHRDLSLLEYLLLDVSGDGEVTSLDANQISRSLISKGTPAYRPIGW